MSQQHEYRFYPSLIDTFQDYLDTKPEEFFYQDENGKWHRNYDEETGTYHLTDDEVYALARQRVLDTINRVDGLPSEAADKGSCFNEIVDCIIMKKKNTRDDIRLQTMRHEQVSYIYAQMDDFKFYFDIDFCKSAARYFDGSMCQVFTKAPIETDYGTVWLYGYIDYLRENKVFDAKTTSRYDFGKYEKKWQKHIYPYCLIKSGKCTDIQQFEYTAFKLSGGNSRQPLITGQLYPEVYTFNYDESKAAIKRICERFIEFIEENKEEITDKKIVS